MRSNPQPYQQAYPILSNQYRNRHRRFGLSNLGSSGIFSLQYPNHLWTETVSAIAKQVMSAKTKSFV
ncbi:hypothetical protein [Nostoc sp. ChiSLP03a]|uniref:hypothetical protein n=1 Tax=Nostoc sp. ChiSLP03a TaxID=3075380 RepID=UPI002AD2A28A|nr:hypothetical protein [Nostoc sp. ChiSLP03a]MDZ8209645.1 hypothetical protein [Nostoc sp. ChiSLP03a]